MLTVDSLEQRFEKTAAAFMKFRGVPGFALGVVNGSDTAIRAYGRREDGGLPVDGHTFYEIGSITKVFTTILLAEMHLRGEVALDDPVNRFLPSHARIPGRGGAVTLRHLATHSSGLPRLPPTMPWSKLFDNNPYADIDSGALYRATAHRGPRRQPGSATVYSNFAMGLLGHVLGLAAGERYERMVQTRLCLPLGLHDTAFTLSEDQRQRLAPGYNGGKIVPNWDFDALAAAGGLKSTVADMTRFVQANLRPADTPLAEPLALAQSIHTQRRYRITRDSRITALVTGLALLGFTEWLDFDLSKPARLALFGGAALAAVYLTPSSLATMGLGWHVSSLKDGTAIRWHNGGTGGYASYLAFAPERGIGIVWLANTTVVPDGYGRQLLTALASDGAPDGSSTIE
jgi:CubicO group peptidase (beta-lactamase class C family)